MVDIVVALVIWYCIVQVAMEFVSGGYHIFVDFVKGLVLGTIYESLDFEEEPNITEHYLQISFFCILVTFMWHTERK